MVMEVINVTGEVWAFVSRRTALNGTRLDASVARARDEVGEKIARAGVRTLGPPRVHYRYRDGDQVGFEMGIPIDPDDEAAARQAGLEMGETLVGEALSLVRGGPHARLGGAYRQMERGLAIRGLKGRGDFWELYLSDPAKCPPNEVMTQILWPVENTDRQATRPARSFPWIMKAWRVE